MQQAVQIWLLLGALALAVSGCQNTALTVKLDPVAPMPSGIPELDPPVEPQALPHARGIPDVRTVRSPESRPRHISLYECITLALESGRLNDTPLRVLSYEPAAAGAEIDHALSRFDALWQSSMIWETTNEPAGLASERILTSQPDINVQNAAFTSRLIKPLATGGAAGIAFRTDYQFGNLNSPVNPAYQPRLVFTFEQPLLQGFGVEINQLRGSHPGGVFTPFVTRGSGPGILLVRVNFDRSRARLETQVQDVLLAVEQAYWKLYQSYWDLYSRETGLRQSLYAWNVGKELAARGELTVQDLAQLEAQYYLFRVQRIDALGNGQARAGVLEAERQLRLVVGLPAEDGEQLIPSDTPTVASYLPCWTAAQEEALTLRPELAQTVQDVREAQLRVLRVRNDLLPDLRFGASYDVNALGSRLDGSSDSNALRSLADNHYNNWSLGLRLDVPIGFREANSRLRVEKIRLAQQLMRLQDQEKQVISALQRSFRELIQAQDRLAPIRGRRLALARQYLGYFALFKAGESAQINVMLEAQRNWAEALRDEQEAITQYNIALADFERQKGTLLIHNNVVITEGALPGCVPGKASDHVRQRKASLQLRQRAAPQPPHSGEMEAALSPPSLAEWNLSAAPEDPAMGKVR